MSNLFVVRVRYCQPDGLGWLTKDGACTSNPQNAQIYKTEDDAWMHLSSFDGLVDHDEEGPYAWVEPYNFNEPFITRSFL